MLPKATMLAEPETVHLAAVWASPVIFPPTRMSVFLPKFTLLPLVTKALPSTVTSAPDFTVARLPLAAPVDVRVRSPVVKTVAFWPTKAVRDRGLTERVGVRTISDPYGRK